MKHWQNQLKNQLKTTMKSTNYHRSKSAGHLEVVVPTIDSDIRANALPASTGPRDRSINMHEFLGLKQTWGSMPQNTTMRASSELVCGNLTGERVQLEVPQPNFERPYYKDKKFSQRQALLIASLNIRGK